jgi:hypothetical protein
MRDGAWLKLPASTGQRRISLAPGAKLFGVPVPLDAMAEWLAAAHTDLSGEVDGWRITVSDTRAVPRAPTFAGMEARRDDVELTLDHRPTGMCAND